MIYKPSLPKISAEGILPGVDIIQNTPKPLSLKPNSEPFFPSNHRFRPAFLLFLLLLSSLSPMSSILMESADASSSVSNTLLGEDATRTMSPGSGCGTSGSWARLSYYTYGECRYEFEIDLFPSSQSTYDPHCWIETEFKLFYHTSGSGNQDNDWRFYDYYQGDWSSWSSLSPNSNTGSSVSKVKDADFISADGKMKAEVRSTGAGTLYAEKIAFEATKTAAPSGALTYFLNSWPPGSASFVDGKWYSEAITRPSSSAGFIQPNPSSNCYSVYYKWSTSSSTPSAWQSVDAAWRFPGYSSAASESIYLHLNIIDDFGRSYTDKKYIRWDTTDPNSFEFDAADLTRVNYFAAGPNSKWLNGALNLDWDKSGSGSWDDDSGLDEFELSMGTNSYRTSSDNFEIPRQWFQCGTSGNTVEIYAYDNAYPQRNSERITQSYPPAFQADNCSPTTTSLILSNIQGAPISSGGWMNETTVRVSLTASDAHSGIKGAFFKHSVTGPPNLSNKMVNSVYFVAASNNVATNSYPLLSEGIHYLGASAGDNAVDEFLNHAPNWGSDNQLTFKVDTRAPSCIHSDSTMRNTWLRESNLSVTLSCSDNTQLTTDVSGIDVIFAAYRPASTSPLSALEIRNSLYGASKNGGGQTSISATFEFQNLGSGERCVDYFSVDVAENAAPIRSLCTFQFDTNAPLWGNMSVTWQTPPTIFGWSNVSQNCLLWNESSVQDIHSGLEGYSYALNTTPDINVDINNSPLCVFLSDGEYNLTLRAIDNVTNSILRNPLAIPIKVDTTPPTINATIFPATWTNSSAQIFYNSSDSLADIWCVVYKVGNSTSFPPCASSSPRIGQINISNGRNDGRHQIYIRAYDRANNFNETLVWYNLDTTPPGPYSNTTHNLTQHVVHNQFLWDSNAKTPGFQWDFRDALSGCAYVDVLLDGAVLSQNESCQASTWKDWPTAISNASHSIELLVVDAVGNSYSEIYYFYVDGTSELNCTISAPANSEVWTNQSTFNITWECNHFAPQDLVHNLSWGPLSNPTLFHIQQASNNTSAMSLTSGIWKIQLFSSTLTGVSSTITTNLKVDVSAPIIQFKNINGTSFQNGSFVNASFSMLVEGLDQHAGLHSGSYYVSGQGQNWIPISAINSQILTLNLTNLGEGNHSLITKFLDEAGNEARAEIHFFLDRSKPYFAAFHVVNQHGWILGGNASLPVLSLHYRAMDNYSTCSHVELQIESTIYSSLPCEPTTYADFLLPQTALDNGKITIQLTATDFQGLISTIEKEYLVDYLDPTIACSSTTIKTYPQMNTISNQTFYFQTTHFFNTTVSIAIGDEIFAPMTSPFEMAMPDATDANISFVSTAASGRQGFCSIRFRMDSTPPIWDNFAIIYGPDAVSIDGAQTNGTIVDLRVVSTTGSNAAGWSYKIDSESWSPIFSTDISFQNLSLNGEDGEFVLQFRLQDPAGHFSMPKSVYVIKDKSPPKVAFFNGIISNQSTLYLEWEIIDAGVGCKNVSIFVNNIFEWSRVGGGCHSTSPIPSNNLQPGNNTIRLYFTDEVRNEASEIIIIYVEPSQQQCDLSLNPTKPTWTQLQEYGFYLNCTYPSMKYYMTTTDDNKSYHLFPINSDAHLALPVGHYEVIILAYSSSGQMFQSTIPVWIEVFESSNDIISLPETNSSQTQPYLEVECNELFSDSFISKSDLAAMNDAFECILSSSSPSNNNLFLTGPNGAIYESTTEIEGSYFSMYPDLYNVLATLEAADQFGFGNWSLKYSFQNQEGLKEEKTFFFYLQPTESSFKCGEGEEILICNFRVEWMRIKMGSVTIRAGDEEIEGTDLDSWITINGSNQIRISLPQLLYLNPSLEKQEHLSINLRLIDRHGAIWEFNETIQINATENNVSNNSDAENYSKALWLFTGGLVACGLVLKKKSGYVEGVKYKLRRVI
ncbi:MAG TPA: hypothetical protein EYG10_02615 [Gammaproteobacteria bacterium]|nr:hypothetical protein [Gammaproteobacteria bacterium]